MKKSLFITMAAATIILFGCSRNEIIDVNKDNAISFENSFVDNITRADATTENLSQFYVTSVMTKGADTAAVFNEQVVNKSGADWTYTPPQYWFAGWDYDFAAWTLGRIGFTNQKVVDAYKGILYGNGPEYFLDFNNSDTGFNGNSDLLTAHKTVTGVTGNYTTPVDLRFAHALSRVKFGFTNAMGNDLITLKVKDIKMTDACALGQYNLFKAQWEGFEDEPAEYTFAATEQINNAAKGNSGVKYLIPTSRKTTYNATFTVEVYNDGILVESKNMTAPINLGAALVKGNSYEINAEINGTALALNQIVFNNITVEVWGDFSNQAITPVEIK